MNAPFCSHHRLVPRLLVLTLTVISVSLHTLCDASAIAPSKLVTAVRRCPCTIHVTASLNAPPLDILIQPVDLPRSPRASDIRSAFSRFSQTPRHAFHTDALLAHYKVRVPIPIAVRVSVHAHGRVGAPARARAAIMPDARQAAQCDVLIEQDPPADAVRAVLANRIIGGRTANAQLAEFMVLLVTPADPDSNPPSGAAYLCTGSVIGPNTVLTAAHCNVTTDSFAIIGETYPESTQKVYFVQSFVPHPQYALSTDAQAVQYDIAYVTLAEEVPSTVPLLKVNNDPGIPPAASLVRAIGYGVTSGNEQGQSYENDTIILNQVDLYADSNQQCLFKNLRVDVEIVPERILCVSGPSEGCGIW